MVGELEEFYHGFLGNTDCYLINIRAAIGIPCYQRRKDCSCSFSGLRLRRQQARLTKLLICLDRRSIPSKTNIRGLNLIRRLGRTTAGCIHPKRTIAARFLTVLHCAGTVARSTTRSSASTGQFKSKTWIARSCWTSPDLMVEKRTIWTRDQPAGTSCDCT